MLRSSPPPALLPPRPVDGREGEAVADAREGEATAGSGCTATSGATAAGETATLAAAADERSSASCGAFDCTTSADTRAEAARELLGAARPPLPPRLECGGVLTLVGWEVDA